MASQIHIHYNLNILWEILEVYFYMNRKKYMPTVWWATSLSFVSLLLIFILDKASMIPLITGVPAIVLFIIGFIKREKESLRKLEIDQAKASVARASKELDTLKNLYDQAMIDEKEYELKKESIKKKYATDFINYVES